MSPSDDPGSDPTGTDECTVDLNGFWVDHASTDRYVEIRHAGGSVSAVYIDGPFVCEHRDEAGTTSQTDKDLSGTLAACVLTGTVTTCTFGCPEPCTDGTTDNPCPDDSQEGNCTNGVTDTPFTATVAPTGDRIEGDSEEEEEAPSEPRHVCVEIRGACDRVTPCHSPAAPSCSS